MPVGIFGKDVVNLDAFGSNVEVFQLGVAGAAGMLGVCGIVGVGGITHWGIVL